jgi:hypothetical protein
MNFARHRGLSGKANEPNDLKGPRPNESRQSNPLVRLDRALPRLVDDRARLTIVNIALPSIRKDLGFSQTTLAWVVNGYLLTFGGFLLLCGRLGDLYGHRRLFLGGIALLTVASAACGAATTQGWSARCSP